MKDKKKLEVLIKVIKIIYDKNPGMQEMIDSLMIEVWTEEGASPEQVFFAVVVIIMTNQERNLTKSIEEIENGLWKF